MSRASSPLTETRLVEIDAVLEQLRQMKEDTVKMIVSLRMERDGRTAKSRVQSQRELESGPPAIRGKSSVACRCLNPRPLMSDDARTRRLMSHCGRCAVHQTQAIHLHGSRRSPGVVRRIDASLKAWEANGPRQARHPTAGDIVVTKVANHYHVGRVEAEGKPWTSIQTMDRLADALTLACRLVSGSQHVFLYDRGDRLHYVEIDCAKPYWLD